jgi:hypothetical protein
MSEPDLAGGSAGVRGSVSERDPMDALIRRERATRKLPEGAACLRCGETNPILLEVHHYAGNANDQQATVVLCLNHHRLQSVDQRAAGVELDSRKDRSLVDRIVSWLRGLGLLFAALAHACREMSDRLAALGEGLDAQLPAWRTLPEAT